MTGWLIVLGVLLLLLGLLLMPLVLAVEHGDSQEQLFWKLSWMGVLLCSSEKSGLLHRMSKRKSRKNKKKDKPEKRRDADSRSMKRYWNLFWDVARILPRPLRLLWKGISLRGLEIAVQVGRFDAKDCATAYGAANALVYTSLGVLQSTMRVKVRQISIQCAFGQPKSRWIVRGKVHFCPLSAAVALLSFAVGYIMQQQRKDVPEKMKQIKQPARTVAEK